MSELVDHVLGMLQPLGHATARRMFGGYGIYLDGQIMAIVANDILYFKVDDQSRPRFDERGLAPFEYQRRSRSVAMRSYYAAPEEALEDPEVMLDWARLGVDAARRSAT